MANNIETLFPNSRTETTKKGKKIYLDLSNYFSLHTKKLISSENDKRIGVTVKVMYKDKINVSYVNIILGRLFI